MDNNQRYYYDPNEIRKNKTPGWKKGLIIFLIIAVIAGGIGVFFTYGLPGTNIGSASGHVKYSDPYIGVLHVEGTISESESSSILSTQSYHHQWTLDRIDDMIADDNNKGLIIYVNSPGGSVYASDELYLKIKEYEKKTGRPVYSYMASEAASGGYYISAACNKIVANRNCWTGSIGVTIGTIYDVTGFLDKLGVKSVTITSGKNKAMGSPAIKMTKEQKAIFQGLVDEAYEQFVGIVADGRGLKTSYVKKIGDGRVYTAKQALSNGLIDKIATYDVAIKDMEKSYKLGSVDVKDITYTDSSSTLLDKILGQAFSNALGQAIINNLNSDSSTKVDSEYAALQKLMEENQTFTITYLTNVQK